MSFRVDLHVHSRHSGDNFADPAEMARRAVERGLHGIVFTEHYTYAASAHAEALARELRGTLLVLRGVEYSSADGHCLVFGADPDRLLGREAPLAVVVRVVHEAGGAVVPSHPYRGFNSAGDLVKRLPGIAAIEGCNGNNMRLMNERAIEVAAELGLPCTGGSDAHEPQEVGSCYTEFETAVTGSNLVALLLSGRYRCVDTRRSSRGPGLTD